MVCMGEMTQPSLTVASGDALPVGLRLADAFRQREPQLFRLALFLTGDRGEAQDLVSDAFERTLRAADRQQIRDLDAYLRKIVVNRARTRWARRARDADLVRFISGRQHRAAPSADDGALSDDLIAALLTLPRRQRTVVVLRNYMDLSEAQTAATMGISVGSVKAHGSRGLTQLRELLKDPR